MQLPRPCKIVSGEAWAAGGEVSPGPWGTVRLEAGLQNELVETWI